MFLQSFPRTQINGLFYQFLKSVYRWEREIHARFGLTYQVLCMLQHLRCVSVARVSDLAANLCIPLFQNSRLVNKVAKRGYLSKQKVADDRRAVQVSLQPKGKTVLHKMEDNKSQVISLNAVELTKEEFRSAC